MPLLDLFCCSELAQLFNSEVMEIFLFTLFLDTFFQC